MGNIRTIKRIVTGASATDGAGVKLVRVIGYYDTKDFDPFLMMDAFDSTKPDDYVKGFPWHPHRGMETITYLLSGDIEHGDSLGNKGSILEGDCQWMTAGSGIIHQEMPKPSKRLLGAQLWLNLPSKEKMTSPKYRDIRKEDIPVLNESDVKVRVISGTYNGTPGAIKGDFVDALYLDVEINDGAQWRFETNEDWTLFIYIISGQGSFEPNSDRLITEKHAVLFNEGKEFWVKASHGGIRFLLMSGKPLGEPVAWGGPIVMNTREELNQAYKELDEGTFIR